MTMNHEYEIRSQVDLVSTPHEIVPEQTRHEEELVAHEIRENPVPSSHNLQNALPAIPGVVQDNNGLIHVETEIQISALRDTLRMRSRPSYLRRFAHLTPPLRAGLAKIHSVRRRWT